MKDMTIDTFCDKHRACEEGREWAKARCPSLMMSEAFDILSKAEDIEGRSYWEWTWVRSWDDRTLRHIAVGLVRETPLADGRKVVDLLTDPRSIAALETAERYADGEASKEELLCAWSDAWDATRDATWSAAWSAAMAAAWSAAWSATKAATEDATWSAAMAATWSATGSDAMAAAWSVTRAAQKQIILSYGNPFLEVEE